MPSSRLLTWGSRDGREAGREVPRRRRRQHPDALVDLELGVEVRAVMADVDRWAEQQVRRAVAGDPRRPTAVVPVERPAVRVADVVADATELHREAVHEDRVARDVLEEDRVGPRDLVEVVRGPACRPSSNALHSRP